MEMSFKEFCGGNELRKRFDDDGNRIVEVYDCDLNHLCWLIDIKNNELAYLYGQERIPKDYKPSIKKALEE